MRILLLGCAVALTLGWGAAYGQQSGAVPSHTGGTCSGHAAACNSGCANRAARCMSVCENRRIDCMQTGTWAGMVTITNVTRK